MRLSKATIRNFKCIEEITLTIPKTDPSRPGSGDFVSIVGKNNTGKSAILEALRLALPGEESFNKPELDHFCGRCEDAEPIEIILEFDDISDDEQKRMGIRTHVHDGVYKIKQVWEKPKQGARHFAYRPQIEYPPSLSEPKLSWSILWADEALVEVLNHFEETQSEQLPRKGRPKGETITKLKEFIQENYPRLAVPGEPGWIENPGGFPANVISCLPTVIFVPAIRETEAETSATQSKSTFRQIANVLFERRLAQNPVIEEFVQAGVAVRELFDSEAGHDLVRAVETRIAEKLERFIDVGASLEFTPPDVQSDLAAKTELWLMDGKLKTKPRHQGHGTQRSLILSLFELLAEENVEVSERIAQRGMIILMEEPEIYLHPQMQRKMRDVLLNISRAEAMQVICTTHSPTLLDLADRHDGIVILERRNGIPKVTQRTSDIFPDNTRDDARQRLRMHLNFDASVNEVFFTEEVCLVEGDCEIAAIDAIAKRLIEQEEIDQKKYLRARHDVKIVNCRGKGTILAFQRVLNEFRRPYRVVHDTDNKDEHEGLNGRIYDELGSDDTRILRHDPNFEQQIFGEDWRSDKPWQVTKRIAELENRSDDLIGFFEFVLGKSIDELAADEEHE